MAIQAVHAELDAELKCIRKLLRMPSLQWITSQGEDYIVEVKKSENRPIPPNWTLKSRTKYFERYQSPTTLVKVEELSRWQEALQAEANRAFQLFLEETSKHYAVMRDTCNKMATADCLLSLALVALQDNYVRPDLTDDDSLEIIDGRHPMVEALRSDPFVPNSVYGASKCKIISGPNMGGKSSSQLRSNLACWIPYLLEWGHRTTWFAPEVHSWSRWRRPAISSIVQPSVV